MAGEKDGEGEKKRWEENCKNACDPTVPAYTYSFVVFCSLNALCISKVF